MWNLLFVGTSLCSAHIQNNHLGPRKKDYIFRFEFEEETFGMGKSAVILEIGIHIGEYIATTALSI